MTTAVTPFTGDIKNLVAAQKFGVMLHNTPQVEATAIADIAAQINDASSSGKRLGAQVMVVDDLETITSATLYSAAGKANASAWVVIKQLVGTGAVDVTPA